MQRQRGELVPIAEAFSDLSGPVAALRDASPQTLHHYTRFDQVNQLVSASEADPDLGFMARLPLQRVQAPSGDALLSGLPLNKPLQRKCQKEKQAVANINQKIFQSNTLPPRLTNTNGKSAVDAGGFGRALGSR